MPNDFFSDRLLDRTPTGAEEGPAPERELSAENQALALVFERWRSKFHDVPDDRFDQVVQSLRNRESIHSIARRLIEEGYCAHMHPTTVRTTLTKFRDAAGFPKYMDRPETEKEDEADQVIEGEPAIKRHQWLTRIQHARVRKALKTEAMMGGPTLATTADDIKLLSDLLDKELAIQLKTGEVRAVPQQVKLDVPGISITEPAEAYRVILAYKRLKALLAPRVDEILGPTGGDLTIDVPPPTGGSTESGPIGPGPGADGEHGRT